MDASEWPMAVLIAIFVAAAAGVWWAGVRVVRLTDALSHRTGLGQAALGMVLLGGITSLPEVAVAITATLQGAPSLTINDILGSASINLVILAVADAIYGREALTSKPPSISVALQGVVSVIAFALAAAATSMEMVIFGIGLGSWLILLTYILCMRTLVHSRASDQWQPVTADPEADLGTDTRKDKRTTIRMVTLLAAFAAVILVTGFMLAHTGEALAHRTGLGTSFFGLAVLALATSLPEMSTVIESVRLKRYTLAIADVFGTNLFNVTILVLIDALSPGRPVLVVAGPFAATAALLALLLSAIFLLGLLERRDRTRFRMGYDSIAVVLAYLLGMVLLYLQRPTDATGGG